MDSLRKLMKSEKSHSLVLDVLFVVYILFNIETPKSIAEFVDTSTGKLVVIFVALTMFAAGPIAGILAVLAGYTLIQRSGNVTGSSYKYTDGAEEIKMQTLQSYNDNPKTLEEQVIADMAPIVRSPDTAQATYKPVLDKLNDAAPIDYQGVV